jgi:uncharacterized protein YuzE
MCKRPCLSICCWAISKADFCHFAMNIAYFKDRDALYFELSPEDPTHAWEAQEGIVINMSADGRVVGIEVERASQRADLSLLRVGNFPGEVVAVDGTAH